MSDDGTSGFPRVERQTQALSDPHPTRAYIIAASPRTGSSLLAEALTATGRAGNPDEFFDVLPKNEQHWMDRYNIPPGPHYLDHLIRASRTPNGLFGFKLHWHQIPALHKRLAESSPAAVEQEGRTVPDLLRRRFPDSRFLWLSRRNKVAQAISYYRAAESKVWRTWNDARSSDERPAKQPVYDHARIERYLAIVHRQDEGWRRFFVEQEIPALVLIYEDFIRAYDQTVRNVLSFLDIPSDGLIPQQPALQRLADAESEAWERRFRAGPLHAATQAKAEQATARPAEAQAERAMRLTAYDVGSGMPPSVVPGGPTRPWMERTPKRFAYRCLPMVIANQWGWLVVNRQRVEAIWNGMQAINGLAVTCTGDGAPTASSHFGSGILTFHIGYLFRTPAGYGLHVRGPANWPRDGVYPLEGIVESDWAEATFTMNWKMTRPNHKVVFEPGEPIAMISPVRRGELELFAPEIIPLHHDPELSRKYNEWSASRDSFNAGLRMQGSDARKSGWQKDYTRGRTVRGEAAPNHQTGLTLQEFKDRRPKGRT
jgi:LPS sulfotransferase NodH